MNLNLPEFIAVLAPPLDAALAGVPLFIALLCIGLGVGFLTGFFGVGGGFLIVPLLNILLGIRYELAVGSSLAFIIGTSLAGILKQHKHGSVYYHVAGFIVVGSAAGAVAGDWFQSFLMNSLAAGRPGVFTLMMHLFFLVLLLGTIFSVKNGAPGDKPPLTARVKIPPFFNLAEWPDLSFSIPATVLTGFAIGFLTGLLGIGGGVVMVPILLGLFGLPHTRASATSLVIVFVTSIVAVTVKSFSAVPKVSLPLALMLLVGSLIGVRFGVALVHRVTDLGFRRYFKYVLLSAMGVIVFDIVRKFLVGEIEF